MLNLRLKRLFHLSLPLWIGLLAIALVACRSDDAEPGAAVEEDLITFVVATDAAIGDQRIPFVLMTADGTRILDEAGRVSVSYGLSPDVEGVIAQAYDDAPPPVFRSWQVNDGVYTTSANFKTAGLYEFVVAYEGSDEIPAGAGSARVLVKETNAAPNVGDSVPPTPSKVATDVAALALITSDPAPRARFYQISVDDAVASGKPTVVSFGTPAWCQTATCGPQLDVLETLASEFEDRVHFVHIEIFDNPADMLGDPGKGRVSPVLTPWNLVSEPWTFVVGSDGLVAARFEAFTTAVELREAIQQVAGG